MPGHVQLVENECIRLLQNIIEHCCCFQKYICVCIYMSFGNNLKLYVFFIWKKKWDIYNTHTSLAGYDKILGCYSFYKLIIDLCNQLVYRFKSYLEFIRQSILWVVFSSYSSHHTQKRNYEMYSIGMPF